MNTPSFSLISLYTPSAVWSGCVWKPKAQKSARRFRKSTCRYKSSCSKGKRTFNHPVTVGLGVSNLANVQDWCRGLTCFNVPGTENTGVCMGMLCWPIAQWSTVMGMHFRPHMIENGQHQPLLNVPNCDCWCCTKAYYLSVFVAFLSYPQASNEQVLVIAVNFQYDWNWNQNHKTWAMPSYHPFSIFFQWSKIVENVILWIYPQPQ